MASAFKARVVDKMEPLTVTFASARRMYVTLQSTRNQDCLLRQEEMDESRELAQLYGNAVHPPWGSPWSLRLQIAFLFPKKPG